MVQSIHFLRQKWQILTVPPIEEYMRYYSNFMVNHDCPRGSFFANPLWNRRPKCWVGMNMILCWVFSRSMIWLKVFLSINEGKKLVGQHFLRRMWWNVFFWNNSCRRHIVVWVNFLFFWKTIFILVVFLMQPRWVWRTVVDVGVIFGDVLCGIV